MIDNNIQPDRIVVNDEVRLVRATSRNYDFALDWYSDKDVLYYSEGVSDTVYDINVINKMYDYLSSKGELYYIELLQGEWIRIGDATLCKDTIPITIGNKNFWGKGIGKLVLKTLITRAKELKFDTLKTNGIYKYNERSIKLFESLGFVLAEETDEKLIYELKL